MITPTSTSPPALLDAVERTRAKLRRVQDTRAVLVSLSAGLLVLLVVRVLLFGRIGPASWEALPALLGIVASVVTWAVQARRRVVLDAVSAALWIEEQQSTPPDFALVTYVEQRMPRVLDRAVADMATGSPSPALARAADAVWSRAEVAAALTRLQRAAVRGPALFAIGASLLVLVTPRAERDILRTDAAQPAQSAAASNATKITPLGAWRLRVVPPSYTGQPAADRGDANSVVALSGSVIVLNGDGGIPEAQRSVVGSATSQAITATAEGSDWRLRVSATDAPSTVRVTRGGRTRLLVIEGHADTVPAVILEQPARDSVFREAKGRLPLVALVRDDIGLASARFELLVSSGEGERFTVRTVTLGGASWPPTRGTRSATIRSTLDLAALALQPGDVVHLRAMARDGHPAADREFGSSETRAFRIARPTEYDSVAVEPAPPPEVDKSLLSQRMLLMLTEKLDTQQPRLARAEVVRESLKLARDQTRLRLAVGDVVFQRLSGESSAEHAHSAGDGHDHGVDQQGGKLSISTTSTTGMLEEGNDSPVIAINQPLLEAYNAMWDAGRALEQGDPHGAIPPMKRALEAIERSRAATRLYLRGRPPQVIVDIAKVRLAGKDTGSTSGRSDRATLPTRIAQRDARLVSAAQLMSTARDAARDTLALLRVESLGDAPAFAAAVGRVLDVLERGGDATDTFVTARRVLGNVVRTPAAAWSRGVPP